MHPSNDSLVCGPTEMMDEDAMLNAEPGRDRVAMTSMPAAPSENALGSPRFEPLRVLGEGGSGIVYEVRIRSGLGGGASTLALKVLRAELAPSERERRRFLAEAERMQRLDAPGLVPLLESGLLPDGRPYLAMPLLDGETLAERLKRGPLPASLAARYFAVLASAVHALHAAGMVHRDVKPENVILVDDSPVLLDFGIARDIDDGTTTTTAEGRVRGTPAYMAPERFFGAPASVRSDVYELGVVLYMMLVGRLPWGSEKNVSDRLNPANPRDAGADVSRGLATVILRALSTRPEVRPATALDLAREVAAAAKESAAPSRRTLDVEIEDPPAEMDEPSTAPAMRERRAISQAPGTERRLLRGVTMVALTCAVAVAAGFGARALGRGTAPPASPSAASAPVAPAPTSCAAGAMPSTVPEAVAGGAALTAPVAMTAAPSAAARHTAASAGARLPPRLGPSAMPSPAPSASVIDPSRYFEDRR